MYGTDSDCAELQLPIDLAYVSGLIDNLSSYDPGDVAVFMIDRHGAKSTVIERSSAQSNLAVSDQELKENTKLATEAIQAELQRWVDNGSFRRQSRQYARNIITSRCVFTWKRRPDNSRYMKCRLCVHGFKDMYRQDLDRYSGTSTRWGQRMVVATAVQAGWDLVSLDISVAFLKGMTFEEYSRSAEARVEKCRCSCLLHGMDFPAAHSCCAN